ncbi:MAG TPA: winged helix-turn-helix domain-containing protein [Actinocrinis sp.]|nr:winged helix-turn-helix domain-containing protein [Actinocrinis sp.]
MPKTQTNPAWGALLDLFAAHSGPLHAKLTGALRAAVRDGRLPRGAALPPSRMLAEELKVSRSTVTRAYGQLITEGYLSAHQGAATRVAWSADPDETDAGLASAGSAAAAPPPRQVRYDMSEWSASWPRRSGTSSAP